MSDYRHKRHKVAGLISHIVCPAQDRRVICDVEGDTGLTAVCLDRVQREEIVFGEIGTAKEPVHFLVQSVPSSRPSTLVKLSKSLTARAILPRVPAVKKRLGGGACWSTGYGISTVGRHGNAEVVRQEVKKQGSEKA